MRGSPVLRALLVFVALFALAPLLWRITQPDASARVVSGKPTPEPAKKSAVEGRLNFSTAASRVTIQHLGKDVWSKASPAAEENFALEIPWPKEGVELHVVAAWPDGTRSAAMRVRLTSPDGDGHERTVWGDAAADEVLTFP